ncbi:MAG TPA: 4-(cytidine 5'-diphospho)-2-C-methyl-D-erythritol kinase [Pyrinomonadaceae bacterium]|nr:4-(cytidine 5'-diphospho)-2-C-methyl-D-erythritol kinase [Pyrinomonadaceae bacterium]
MPGEKFTVPAFAKVNLSLRVLGRRADGYHEIRTVFQTVSLNDTIHFEPTADGSLELVCAQPGVPADRSNLVLRAAAALRERFGVRAGARVFLEKRIPAGGGLGGGSSDAAVTLLALAHVWGLETGRRELSDLGAKLGADVPFFLTGGRALGMGRGEEILPLEDVPRQHLVVVTPPLSVSTAEAYRSLSAPALTKVEAAANLSVSRAEAEIPPSLCEVMRNDFEPVVSRLHPETGRAREALLRAGARCAMLSGSGSSVFGVFDSEAGALAAGERAAGSGAGWRAFACSTLTRAEYKRALGKCAAIL